MNLFYLQDHVLHYKDEVYALKPFRDLIDRDKSEDKEVCLAELSYIYFMYDPRSDFYDKKNLAERESLVLESVYGLPDKWKPDAKVKAAADFYKEVSGNIFVRLLESAEIAVENAAKYMTSVDLFEVDDKGKQTHDVNKLVAAIDKVPKLIDSLSKARKSVEKELSTDSGARGSIEKGMFEDGI